jgi:hypothetical protein
VPLRATETSLDSEQVTRIVGQLYERVVDHILDQYDRQDGHCAGCGRTLPTRADALPSLDGSLECIDCKLTSHRMAS